MSTNDVIVRLRAVGQAAFEGAMQGAAKSVSGVGDAAGTTAKETDKLGQSAGKAGTTFRSAAGKIARWAGTALVVGKAVSYMHGSIEATEDLAKSTLKLSRTTGMSTQTASAWAEMAKSRNIDTAALNRGMVTLSKQMSAAAGGTKTAVATFKALGISMDTVKAGDTNSVIMQTADALSKMENPAQRAALAQKLFARQGQELLPVLMSGSQGIREQIDMAKKYGAVMGDDGVKHTKEMAAQQRELKYASDGLKVSIGSALVPVLLSLTTMLTQLAAVMQPLLRNSTALKVVIVLLTTAFLAYKVAVIASTIASIGMVGVWAIIPVLIAAIVVGLVLLWKKTNVIQTAFRAVGNAARAVWNWIKANWPLLTAIMLGPIALATYGAFKKFKFLRDALTAMIGFFRDWGGKVVHAIVEGITAAPGAILNAIKSLLPGGLVKKIGGALKFWATGGLVPHTQMGVVGERGPELVQLPGGTRITPLSAPASRAPALAGATAGAAGRPVIAQVFLDRRMIATAVADDTGDRKARR